MLYVQQPLFIIIISLLGLIAWAFTIKVIRYYSRKYNILEQKYILLFYVILFFSFVPNSPLEITLSDQAYDLFGRLTVTSVLVGEASPWDIVNLKQYESTVGLDQMISEGWRE